MEGNLNSKWIVTLVDGKVFTMNGVSNILGFDEGYILLDTSSGRMCVEGSDLKLESLTKDTGSVLIKGNISGFFLSESQDKKNGIFKRLFG